MNRGLSIATAGMLTAQAQSEIIGDNIANVNTPGFKEEQGAVEPFEQVFLARLEGTLPELSAQPLGRMDYGVKVSRIALNPMDGGLSETNRNEDFALTFADMGLNQGQAMEGFFAVQTPGGERYTRNGSFHLDGGTLRTAEGYPVLFVDNNGQTVSNVQLASGFKINMDGTVIDQQGRSLRLKVVEGPVQSFNRETNLGQSLYAANQAPQLANGNIVVHQGMIEHSNVDLAGQMTQMITVMRAYEANQKAIQAQDGLTDKAANEVGKV